MKFKKTLLRTLIPEWSRHYISYKALKQLLKEAQKSIQPGSEGGNATTAFNFALDRELEKVNNFYLYKRSAIERRIRILDENYKLTLVTTSVNAVNSTSVDSSPQSKSSSPSYKNRSPPRFSNSVGPVATDEETDAALLSHALETKNIILMLLKYTDLNRRGFRKILKKQDKKLGTSSQNSIYETKIIPLPFSFDEFIPEYLYQLEKIISEIHQRLNQSYQVEPLQESLEHFSAINLPSILSKDGKDEQEEFINILEQDRAEDFVQILGNIKQDMNVTKTNFKKVQVFCQ